MNRYSILLAIVVFTLASCASPQGALMTGVQQRNSTKIDQALKEGADVNARYGQNRAIHKAVTPSYSERSFEWKASKNKDYAKKEIGEITGLLEHLLEKGANINELNNQKESALCLASKRKHYLPVIEFLLEKGADPNTGKPALHCAVNQEIAELLVRNQADVNTRFDGETPLHLAVRNQKFQMAKYLVAKGADVNARNQRGERPVDLLTEVSITQQSDGAEYFHYKNEIPEMVLHILVKGPKSREYENVLKDTRKIKYNNWLNRGEETDPDKWKCKKYYSYLGVAALNEDETNLAALHAIGARKARGDGRIVSCKD